MGKRKADRLLTGLIAQYRKHEEKLMNANWTQPRWSPKAVARAATRAGEVAAERIVLEDVLAVLRSEEE